MVRPQTFTLISTARFRKPCGTVEVQQVCEESLLIQEAEEPCNLAPLEENELQGVVGGTITTGEDDDAITGSD